MSPNQGLGDKVDHQMNDTLLAVYLATPLVHVPLCCIIDHCYGGDPAHRFFIAYALDISLLAYLEEYFREIMPINVWTMWKFMAIHLVLGLLFHCSENRVLMRRIVRSIKVAL